MKPTFSFLSAIRILGVLKHIIIYFNSYDVINMSDVTLSMTWTVVRRFESIEDFTLIT